MVGRLCVQCQFHLVSRVALFWNRFTASVLYAKLSNGVGNLSTATSYELGQTTLNNECVEMSLMRWALPLPDLCAPTRMRYMAGLRLKPYNFCSMYNIVLILIVRKHSPPCKTMSCGDNKFVVDKRTTTSVRSTIGELDNPWPWMWSSFYASNQTILRHLEARVQSVFRNVYYPLLIVQSLHW